MNQQRKGFSIVETVVATTVLSIALLTLGEVAAASGVVGHRRDINTALDFESKKFDNVSLTSLDSWSTKDRQITRAGFSYTRKLDIQMQGPTTYTVKIVIVPTVDSTKADSVTLSRTLAGSGSPLCSGC